MLDHASSVGHDDVRLIPTLLKTLREAPPPPEGVLSVYLATPLVPVAGQAYMASFRDGCDALRSSLPEQALEDFDRAVERARQYLAEVFVPRRPGLALFASGNEDYFHVAPLPGRPEEEFAWGTVPMLAPLEQVIDEYERLVIALFDKRRARLFSIFLGAIEESQVIESDVPGKPTTTGRDGRPRPQRQAFTAGAPGQASGGGGGGVTRARYTPHHEIHAVTHARTVARALTGWLRARPFDRLLLAGPVEGVSLLRDNLPRPLRSRLAGELSLAMSANDAEVVQAALEAGEAIERRDEVAMIDELIASSATPRAALGFGPTLDALSDNRVHQLFLTDTFIGVGGECPTCGRLIAGPGRCPVCGTEATPLGDLRERMVERALEQGARIETVSGDAGAHLTAHGGLGAWTHY